MSKTAVRPGKIVCVGRNYREHAKELGNEVPKEPLIFLKPPSSVIASGDAIRLNSFSNPMLLSYISRIMTLEPGDLVATGTPAGVSKLKEGDVVEVEIVGVSKVSNPVKGAVSA